MVGRFNRDSWAKRYAKKHLDTDPGICDVFYLPTGAPDREIRLVEVNELLATRETDPIEPLDFGVGRDSMTAHTLSIVDVTPKQWAHIKKQKLSLPPGWSLEGMKQFSRNAL